MSGELRRAAILRGALRPRVELRVNGRVIFDGELRGLADAVLGSRFGHHPLAQAPRGAAVELRVSIAGAVSGEWLQRVEDDPDDPGPVPPSHG